MTTVELPVYLVTSAAFGGPNLDELYVTTANYQLDAAKKSERPDSGAVFKVTGTGSVGFAGVSAKIQLS